MEWLLLVVLGPSTIRSTKTTVNAGGISANRSEATTLLEGRLSHIHAAWVTHTIRLTTPVLWAETILHQFFVILCSNLSSRTRRVGATEVGDAWSRMTRVRELCIVTITLETSWILWHGLGWNKTLSTIVTKSIHTKTSLGSVRDSHCLLMARTWHGT